MVVQNIRHTGIVVDNLESSLDFYVGLLGFQIVNSADEDEGFIYKILNVKKAGLKTTKLCVGEGNRKQLIELLSFNDKYANTNNVRDNTFNLTTVGLTHIALGVNGLDHLYKKLRKKGVKFISQPEIAPDKYAKVCFCRAPEGTYIELVELQK